MSKNLEELREFTREAIEIRKKIKEYSEKLSEVKKNLLKKQKIKISLSLLKLTKDQ